MDRPAQAYAPGEIYLARRGPFSAQVFAQKGV